MTQERKLTIVLAVAVIALVLVIVWNKTAKAETLPPCVPAYITHSPSAPISALFIVPASGLYVMASATPADKSSLKCTIAAMAAHKRHAQRPQPKRLRLASSTQCNYVGNWENAPCVR